MSTILARYNEACRKASTIKSIESQACEVYPGTNEGYFIEAFGKLYRFHIECQKEIAQLFIDIVAIGPVDQVA